MGLKIVAVELEDDYLCLAASKYLKRGATLGMPRFM